MVDPIPEKIKSCLGELSPAQQVILRGYIGTLRAEIKDKENDIRALKDDDPIAHYHGEHKCTEDHGHADVEHDHADCGGHDHGHDDHKEGHDHGHDDHKKGHDHGHDDHKKESSCGGHDHGHDDHKKEEKSHDHGHDHHKKEEKSHDHGHDHHKEEEEKKPSCGDKPCCGGHDDHKEEKHGHDHGHEHKHAEKKETAADPMALNWEVTK